MARITVMGLLQAVFLLCSVSLVVGAMPQRSSPGNVDTLLSEAGALVQAGRLEEAETATRKIVGSHPRNAEAHSLLGVILDQRGAAFGEELLYFVRDKSQTAMHADDLGGQLPVNAIDLCF